MEKKRGKGGQKSKTEKGNKDVQNVKMGIKKQKRKKKKEDVNKRILMSIKH